MPNPRVFLGPIEVAGVLWDYRCGLRKLGVDAQLILWDQHKFKYNCDKLFGIRSMIPERAFYHGLKRLCNSDRLMKILIERRQHDKIEELKERFDVFHFVSGLSLTPFNADVTSLKISDKKIAMTYFGCDIRCTSSEIPTKHPEKTCLCKITGCCQTPCNYANKIKMLQFWSRNADVVFAGPSSSQLLDLLEIPYKLACSAIDISHWKEFNSNLEKDKLLIVHAPSRKLRKGTDKIIEAIHQLQKKYDLDFKLMRNIPNTSIREWFNMADIVVDQLGRGWHGRVSVESMAMGNPTLCHINPEYKQKFIRTHDLPLINITADTIYDRLEELIVDPQLRKKVGKVSRKYVEKTHSSEVVCKELLDIYRRL